MLPDPARLSISAFDLHIWPSPLTKAAQLAPAFKALADPAAYRALRSAGPAPQIDSAHFRTFATPTERPTHHFWRHYEYLIDATAPADERDLLVPLRCKPKDFAPTFTAAGLPAARAHLTVWLWPFGRASQVELGFRDPLTFGQAEQIASTLWSPAGKPFTVGGKALSLVDLFVQLGDRIHADVTAAGKPLPEILSIPRQAVVGLTAKAGQPFQRFAPAWASDDASDVQLDDDERARLASLIARNKVTLGEANLIGQTGGAYGFARLRRAHYAITHPRQGAVVMLRHHSDCGWTRGAQLCLLGNVRTSLIAWAALRGLTGQVDATQHAALVAAGTKAKGLLPSYYLNPVFKSVAGWAGV